MDPITNLRRRFGVKSESMVRSHSSQSLEDLDPGSSPFFPSSGRPSFSEDPDPSLFYQFQPSPPTSPPSSSSPTPTHSSERLAEDQQRISSASSLSQQLVITTMRGLKDEMVEDEGGTPKYDYWAKEGSRIFDKWAPQPKVEVEEKQKGIFSRSLKRILGGANQAQKADQPAAPAPEVLILFDPNYKFLHSDSPENLVFLDAQTRDGIPIIRGGTLAKLIERLTYDKYVDTNYLQQFLLTYRTFTTPKDFLAHLIERYNVPNPVRATPEQMKKFQAQKQVVRLRTFNVIKTWVDKHFYDFENDKTLVEELLRFTETLTKTGMEKSATFLTEFLSRKRLEKKIHLMVGVDDGKEKQKNAADVSEAASEGIPPLMSEKIQLSDLNNLEVAKQMTLIEMEIYRSINPSEFTNQGWMKGTKEEKERNAPNVLALIEKFNHVSNWVSTTIVCEEDLESRRDLLVYFIHLANRCREIHNFNAMMEVISGVTATSTYRLKKTWALVDRNTLSIFEELNTLLSRDNNFANFRKALHKVQPPALPYLGVYLTDMTFVDQGNSDFLPGTQLINFHKRRLLSFVIREIQQYQQLPYTFPKVGFIRDYLTSLKFKTEEECYAQSLKIEPREEAPKSAPKVNLPLGFDPPTEFEFDYPDDYPFKEEDQEENLAFLPFDESRQKVLVKGGTLEKLIERLTYHKYPDSDLLSAFLLTYRSFCTPKQLLDLLLLRFNHPLPINCLEEDLKRYKEEQLTPIRLRVANVLKNWMDKQFQDFMEDRSLVSSFLLFIKNNAGHELVIEKTLDQLKKLIQRKLKEQLEVISSEEAAQGDVEDILKYTLEEKITLYSFQPAEFAGQMAALHKKLFMSIDVVKMLKANYEFAKDFGPGGNLSMAKTYKFREVPGHGIILLDLFSDEAIMMHEHFEKIQAWVGTSLIEASDLAQRVEVMTRFIEMAETSRQHGNYFGMAGIVGGLNSHVARVFKKAWAVYPSKPHLILLQDMTKLVQKAPQGEPFHLEYIKKIRRSTNQAASFTLHLAPYLEKLTQYAMEPDFFPQSGLINFDKRRRIAAILNEISTFQKKPLEIVDMKNVQRFLLSLPEPESDDLLSVAVAANEMDENGKDDLSAFTFAGFGRVSRRKSLDSSSNTSENSLPRSSISLPEKEETPSDFVKEIKEIASEVIFGRGPQNEFSQPFQETLDRMKKEMTSDILSLYITWNAAGYQQQSEIEKQILLRLFPSEELKEWREEDRHGSLLGWPSTVRLHLIQKESGLVLVKLRPQLTLSDISLFVRERNFFNKGNEEKERVQEIMVLTHFLSLPPSLAEFAQLKDIILRDLQS